MHVIRGAGSLTLSDWVPGAAMFDEEIVWVKDVGVYEVSGSRGCLLDGRGYVCIKVRSF
jgi:hypothetical protein